MSLPISLNIKKVRVSNTYIEYKEKNDQSDSCGKVAFHLVEATLRNVTDMPDYIDRNNKMELIFNTSFLNITPFHTTRSMNLRDSSGRFQLDARIGRLNATDLNPLLKPVVLAEIKNGKINGLQYHLTATNRHANGNRYSPASKTSFYNFDLLERIADREIDDCIFCIKYPLGFRCQKGFANRNSVIESEQ